MTRTALAIVALAAALSTAAYAGDSKPVQMTDEQMDQVVGGVFVSHFITAGDGSGTNNSTVFVEANHFGSGSPVRVNAGGGSNFFGTGPGGGAFTSTPPQGAIHCNGGAVGVFC